MKAASGVFVWNGIDRLDSSVEYVISNCVPCCSKCNVAKHFHAVDDFLSWVDRIATFRGYIKPASKEIQNV
jgi:5-methylcytosine-specific restriction endonuclease McrA